MDVTELLDALYYHLVLGAPDVDTVRANLERVAADVADLLDTLELYGLDALVEAVNRANQGEVVPA